MIDTHQHLLYPDRFTCSWTRDLPALQGPFPLASYQEAAQNTAISGSIFMEVDVDPGQAADEGRFFCSLAEEATNRIAGVIAAARPEAEGFEAYLDSISHPRLVGIRRVLHTQPDELSESHLFRENLRLLGRRGLPFDLCVLQRQLPLATELAKACPETAFVLDHCGVPDIAGNDAPHGEGFQEWQRGIRSLAERPNTTCKIFGLTAYARPDQCNTEGLSAYVNTVLEAFGPSRCLWGGDWPVVNLGSGLVAWCELTSSLLTGLTVAERKAVLHDTARRVYLNQFKAECRASERREASN